MAMAWCAAAACAADRVRGRWRPASAPSITVRRDAWNCISARRIVGGADGVECDLFPVLRNLSQGCRPARPRIFGTFVALLQGQYRLSGSPGVTLPPYFAGREPGDATTVRSGARPRAVREKGTNCMDHRIASARSGADRLIRRRIAGSGHGRGNSRARRSSRRNRRKSRPRKNRRPPSRPRRHPRLHPPHRRRRPPPRRRS